MTRRSLHLQDLKARRDDSQGTDDITLCGLLLHDDAELKAELVMHLQRDGLSRTTASLKRQRREARVPSEGYRQRAKTSNGPREPW